MYTQLGEKTKKRTCSTHIGSDSSVFFYDWYKVGFAIRTDVGIPFLRLTDGIGLSAILTEVKQSNQLSYVDVFFKIAFAYLGVVFFHQLIFVESVCTSI